ncbi:putative bifunctional diguanylate cyclase/phosphodiesterase [Actinotalea solisilvae]|uniref:putative bifunctional diguanylate cyclase/phosphodiesterase n=1 Tax=Actinotalea solisilvae TaxID=2072922 RepID=UPI0018F162AC|nr:GGDEF domain-containing phosphodiesterase [Actinotalea solisilvae]
MRAERLPAAVLLAGALAVLVFLVAPVGSPAQVAAFLAPFVATTALLGARAWRARGPHRRALQLLWFGSAAYLVGMGTWYLAPVVLGVTLDFPTVLDGVFFVSFGVYTAFLTVVLRHRAPDRRAESRIAATDSLILTCAASAAVWVLQIEPGIHTQAPVMARAVALVYPAANVVIFALAARLAVSGRLLASAPGALLLAWIGFELAGDVFYGTQVTNGTFEHGGPLTVTWLVSYSALAALAVHPRLPALLRGARGRDDVVVGERAVWVRYVRHGLLLGATLVPLALIALSPDAGPGLLVLACVTFVLVIVRVQLLSGDLGDQRRLTAEQRRLLDRVEAQNLELARYAAIVDSTDDSVLTVTLDGLIATWNPGATRLYGYTAEEAVGGPSSVLVHDRDAEAFTQAFTQTLATGHARIEALALRRDGTTVEILCTLSVIRDADGEPAGVVGIARDITDRKAAEAQLREHALEMRRQAFQDPLTGLGNRALFTQRVAELTDPAAGLDLREIAVIMLDLDDFKVVNDSLGHEAGDALLTAAARRLGDIVGERGTVTRLGGDEFTVILPRGGEAAGVALGTEVLEAFAHDFQVLGLALRTATSVGVTTGAAGADAGSLLRSADLAMYAAKAAGKGTLRVYQEGLLHQAHERLQLENHLRHAVQRGELALEYQPIVDAGTGAVVGLEALARWHHPRWGAVSPGAFIPVAEASGTIVVIGEWVLRTACREAAAFAVTHGRPVGISVNVSVRQLQADGFRAVVEDALAEAGLAPELLTLEVTESLFMSDDPRSAVVLDELHALGVELSVDDFGTGHSSLARLRLLPVSELKVDRSFVSAIGEDGECGPIITAVVAMARALDLSVVAEGVETAVQLTALRRAGCDRIQGFHIARPMPAAGLATLPRTLGSPSTVVHVPTPARRTGTRVPTA